MNGCIDEEVGQIGISRPDELGAIINNIISPDIFENRDDSTKDLYDADFKCNVTDSGTISRKFPEIKDRIPERTNFIYFMSTKGMMDPDRMAEYINRVCGDKLPKKLDVEEMIYLGSHNVLHRDDGEKQDVVLFPYGSYVGSSSARDDKIRKDVDLAWKNIREQYPNAGVMIKFGDKNFLQKYLGGTNVEMLKKLQDGVSYLIIFTLQRQLSMPKILKIAMGVDAVVEIFQGKDLEESDVLSLGQLKKRLKGSEDEIVLDVYAIPATFTE